jgi:hypothetical protein
MYRAPQTPLMVTRITTQTLEIINLASKPKFVEIRTSSLRLLPDKQLKNRITIGYEGAINSLFRGANGSGSQHFLARVFVRTALQSRPTFAQHTPESTLLISQLARLFKGRAVARQDGSGDPSTQNTFLLGRPIDSHFHLHPLFSESICSCWYRE